MISTEKAPELAYVDVPRHVWDAVNNAIHTSSINGNEMPISLCYVAVRAALKAYTGGRETVEVKNALGMPVCKHCLKSNGEHNTDDQCIDNRGHLLGTGWEPLRVAA